MNEDSCGTHGYRQFQLTALEVMANNDDILKQHLDHIQLSSRNVTYMSPLIQNEIIEIIGHDIILRNLLEEIKAAKLYSIIANEVTSHNKEQLALCARFIDKNNDVREDFIAFIHLPRITGEVIAETIVSTLQGLGLEIENVRGQGYDCAANMSSDNVRGGSASNKRALAKGCICTLQWSFPESGNFPQLCFTANQERDR